MDWIKLSCCVWSPCKSMLSLKSNLRIRVRADRWGNATGREFILYIFSLYSCMSHLESGEKVNYFLWYSIFESLQRFGGHGVVPDYQVLCYSVTYFTSQYSLFFSLHGPVVKYIYIYWVILTKLWWSWIRISRERAKKFYGRGPKQIFFFFGLSRFFFCSV